jgi:hypothetical protein
MIKRLLIIITRMYATKRGGNDEFTLFWATAEEAELNHLLFENITDQERRSVLVIHGHGYPGRVEREVIEHACNSITEGFSEIESTADDQTFLTGLALHPHPSWIDADIQLLSQELQSCLEELGARVEFVEVFAGGGALEKILAPQCRPAGPGFAAAFDRVWSGFSARKEAGSKHPTQAQDEQGPAVDLSDYARRLGLLKHELTHLFQPIDIDLQGWQQSNFNPDYGREIIDCYKNNKAQARLLEARRLVQGSETEKLESVRAIVEEAMNKDAGRAQALQIKWNSLDRLFSSSGFEKAEMLLKALGEESGLTDDSSSRPHPAREKKGTEEILARLRGMLESGNDFHLWYVELEAGLNELRNLLS